MLGTRSATSQYMDRANRGNSSMTRSLNSRRDIVQERRLATSKTNRTEEAIRKASVQEERRLNKLNQERDTEKLIEHRDSRKVISLLERIAAKMENMDRGGGLGNAAGSVLGGAVLARMLGRSNAKAAAKAQKGFAQDAKGRWRNEATGRYAAAPVTKPGFLQRGFNALGRSPIGRFGGAVARSPVGKFAGAAARSPMGRIAAQGGRLGMNVLGKLAIPVAMGMGVFDGVNGMRNADKILGRETTGSEKAKVGIAQVVNGFLMGLPDWLSKRLFNQSFAKLMVDGLGDVKKKIHDKVTEIWDGTRKMIGNGFGAVTKVYHSALDGMAKYGAEISAAGAGLVAAIKARDMKGAIQGLRKLGSLLIAKPIATAQSAVRAGGEAVAEGGRVVAKGVVTGVKVVANTAKAGAATVAGWMGLGSTSAKYESGNRGVMAISSGKGDPGGASYGKYQLSSKKGTLQKYLKSSGYASQFAGMSPGSKEFNDKWRSLGKGDPKFAESQHEFIKQTHFDPAAKKASQLGFNMKNKGVQDAVWSASVQHGGVNKVLAKAANTPGWEGMNDEQKLKRLYEVRSEYAVSNMSRDGASNKQITSVRDRYSREIKDVLALSNSPNAGMAPTAGKSDVQMTSTQSANTPAITTVMASMPKTKTTAKSSASMSSVSQPIAPDLPKPNNNSQEEKSLDPYGPMRKLQAMTKQLESDAAKPIKTASQSGSGGGLPRISDIADRPRIDLQAITTTLAGRG